MDETQIFEVLNLFTFCVDIVSILIDSVYQEYMEGRRYSLVRSPVEPVHDVYELVVQQIAVLVLLEAERDQSLLEPLVVLGDLVLVLCVDLHAELIFYFTLVGFVMLHLDNMTSSLIQIGAYVIIYVARRLFS